MTRTLTLILITLLSQSLLRAGPAGGELRGGVLWYSNAPDSTTLHSAARRYEIGITGPEFPEEKVEMRSLNPEFLWFMYNSGTDNFVPPHNPVPEHELLVTLAQSRGMDPEDAYLHYKDDTVVVLEGDTLLIPGWGTGTAITREEARAPVYHKTLIRRLLNFSTPATRQLLKEVLIGLNLDEPFSGTVLYPDGLFLDNSAHKLFNYGIILSGGHVLETPGDLLIGSDEFQDWHWEQNLGPFLAAMKDTLETSASWSKDGRRKFLMINVSNIWDDSYVSLDVTDYLFMEFQYNPVRAFGVTAVEEAFRRDKLASDAGIHTFYAPTMTRSVLGKPDLYGYDEIMLGNLAWYLTTRTANTVFFQLGTATPSSAGWDTLTWRGCQDVADTLLGEPVAPPYRMMQGTDPLGNRYVVTGREYQGGLVILRNRGEWFEGIEPETAINVPLPTSLLPVDPEGDIGDPVEEVQLRNGQGALFVSRTVPVHLLSFTAVRAGREAIVRWETSRSAAHSTFQVYRETDQESRVQLSSNSLVGPGPHVFRDENPPSGSVHYWLAERFRSGVVEWHGPATVSPIATSFSMSPNHPNPFRSTTRIRFELQEEGHVRIQILDVAGRFVAGITDQIFGPGEHVAEWNGRRSNGQRAAPGLYLTVLESGVGRRTHKMILLP